MWLACYSQEEIAAEIGYAQKAVSEFLNSLQLIPNGTDAVSYNIDEKAQLTAQSAHAQPLFSLSNA